MWYQNSGWARFTSWEFRMAPKNNHEQAQETMLEEPNENRMVPPESIGEEEPITWKDQDEPESEKEQQSSILFT